MVSSTQAKLLRSFDILLRLKVQISREKRMMLILGSGMEMIV